MTDVREVRRALLAVYDKTGVVELARGLAEMGVSLVSSGGTAATLREAGLEVTPVEEVTGSPEMLDGRVKTLHPRIHGGLLADKRKPEHLAQLAEHGIEPFDLVVVNLYPFRETVASGSRAGRRDREDRHRRDRRWSGPPRRTSSRWASSWIRPDTRRYSKSSAAAAGFRATRASASPRPRSPTRLPTTPRSPGGSPSRPPSGRCRGSSVSRSRRSATSATGRTRTSVAPCIARVRSRHRADRRAARGRSRPPGQGHVVQQLARCGGGVLARRGTCRRRACVIVKHNNPCGVAVAAAAGRGLPARVRLRHGLRLRRDRRLRRDVHGRRRGGDARRLHRGRDRSGLRIGGARRVR